MKKIMTTISVPYTRTQTSTSTTITRAWEVLVEPPSLLIPSHLPLSPGRQIKKSTAWRRIILAAPCNTLCMRRGARRYLQGLRLARGAAGVKGATFAFLLDSVMLLHTHTHITPFTFFILFISRSVGLIADTGGWRRNCFYFYYYHRYISRNCTRIMPFTTLMLFT